MFLNYKKRYEELNIEKYISGVTDEMVQISLNKNLNEVELTHFDFLNLLSKPAEKYLELMAERSNKLTKKHFGNIISLYAPLYISNHCSNHCTYCGFSSKNKIARKQLTLKEIEEEANSLSKTGIQHILLLTGETNPEYSIPYIIDAIKILKKYFSSIGLEIFPMDQKDYERVVEAGADSLTIYQEVYDEDIYKKVHLTGKKSNYDYRLDTPERGAKAGFRAVNIGTLFGLGEIISEAFYSGVHAKYLINKYLDVEFSLSLPRINPAEGGFKADYNLTDKKFVQIVLAYRLFLPTVGINISTREDKKFRDNMLSLGITKFSAGSKTSVGGYEDEDKENSTNTTAQFETSDKRSVDEIVKMINSRGYQAVFKDWEVIW